MSAHWHRVVFVLCSATGIASCDLLRLGRSSASASAAEELAARCVEFDASYVPPFGSRSEEPQKTSVVVRQLGLPAQAGRVNAARRILEHSECYDAGILLGAISVTAAAGDPRPLRHLEEIATGRGYLGRCRTEDSAPGPGQGGGNGQGNGNGGKGGNDEGNAEAGDEGTPDTSGHSAQPVRIRYTALVRLASAAAIGRIVETPLVPSGAELAVVEPESIDEALAALALVAVCAKEPADLRTAAIESMGIIRNPSVQPLLELLAEDPGGQNATTSLVMKLAAERSQTTILVNNHSANSSTAEELADLLRQYREEGSAP